MNRGGPGQTELRFAEDDARHVADLRPALGDVQRALDSLVLRAAEARRRGAEAQVLFYYSGHARASALNLGDEEFPLADLRAQLLAMPAAVTIVLLDACQSGAISRIKGAEPTADFSYNSVNRLTTAGIAVMASSSATELSQESESLGSSYFTHHLLVGLRGAGDTDHDGRVTLSEAYRYAYNQTLAATAATAVGSQHATLETGLRGVRLANPKSSVCKATVFPALWQRNCCPIRTNRAWPARRAPRTVIALLETSVGSGGAIPCSNLLLRVRQRRAAFLGIVVASAPSAAALSERGACTKLQPAEP
jgi:hypothetical protein